MSGFTFYISLVVSVILFFAPMPIIANAVSVSEPPAAKISEIKFFSLNHKEVVAVAVETSLAQVADPLSYTYEPQYHLSEKNNSLTLTITATPPVNPLTSPAGLRLFTLTTATTAATEFTLTTAYNPHKTKASLTSVKRKRVLQPDNTIVFRTYLVLTFTDTTLPPVKTIVLDPGHGGTALGAVSNSLLEKELNLDIALLSRPLFQAQGYDVYMTRTDDSNPALLARADAANILQADIFLSIHNNSVPTDMPAAAKQLYRGTTALYNAAAPRPAKELAKLLADELAATLHIHEYPLQDRPNLVVLNSTWVPAVIVEVAMMPHPQDAKMLSQRIYRQQAATAIFQAAHKYFSLPTLEYRGDF